MCALDCLQCRGRKRSVEMRNGPFWWSRRSAWCARSEEQAPCLAVNNAGSNAGSCSQHFGLLLLALLPWHSCVQYSVVLTTPPHESHELFPCHEPKYALSMYVDEESWQNGNFDLHCAAQPSLHTMNCFIPASFLRWSFVSVTLTYTVPRNHHSTRWTALFLPPFWDGLLYLSGSLLPYHVGIVSEVIRQIDQVCK